MCALQDKQKGDQGTNFVTRIKKVAYTLHAMTWLLERRKLYELNKEVPFL